MNEFNYEGWVGKIFGYYSSTSQFPPVGSDQTIYVVLENGKATSYIYDTANGQYVLFGSGTDESVLHYRGPVASASDLPSTPANGDVYIATASFVVSSKQIDAGDMLIWNERSSEWDIIQGNITIEDLQSDWNQTDNTAADYIKNKPTVPELWEIGKASYKPTASTPCVSFQDVKCNGELYNGKLSTYVTVIKNGIVVNMMALSTESATTFVDGAFDAPLSQGQIDFIKQYADTILFRLGTNNGSKLLNATFILPLRATSITSGENGFTSGDQVYNALPQTVAVSGETPSITAEDNRRYVCGTVTTLSITPPVSGMCDIVFTSGATATVLTIPNTVTWAGGFDPTNLETNMKYELNIMDGIGVAIATEISV